VGRAVSACQLLPAVRDLYSRREGVRRLGKRRGDLFDALGRLLLQCFGSKVGRSLSFQLSRRRNNYTQVNFRAALVLTDHCGIDESLAETRHNGQVQTIVCSQTKGL
jgi:hypothetical protein